MDAEDLVKAHAVREALRGMLAAHHDAAPVNPAVRALLDAAAVRARLTLVGDAGGALDLVPRATGLDRGLGHLLAIADRAQADGSWQRLRVCANDECRWAFYDASRNRSGRWCSMAICGNREKGRTHRATRQRG